MAVPANLPKLLRGMHIRRQNTNVVCSIGPFFTDGTHLYFFTVQHGMGQQQGANRVIEATFDGNAWVAVGRYITGVQNASVDWALVRIDEGFAIGDTLPQGLQAQATGIGFTYQANPLQYRFFTSASVPANCRGNLNGQVDNSPTVTDQYQFLTSGQNRADAGDSGMAVYTAQGGLLGIEWGIYWNGPQQQHTFYVQPIGNVCASLLATVQGYDNNYRNSAAPAPVWALVKPIADAIQEQGVNAQNFLVHNTI